MTPEARETYEAIRALRDRIGPINFNIVAELRKMRGYEDERRNDHEEKKHIICRLQRSDSPGSEEDQ